MSADVSVFTDIGDDAKHEWASLNVTYNLSEMLREAGFVGWPKARDTMKASEFLAHLAGVLATLKANPDKYSKYDSPNGWGTYLDLIPSLEEFFSRIPLHRNDLQLSWWL